MTQEPGSSYQTSNSKCSDAIICPLLLLALQLLTIAQIGYLGHSIDLSERASDIVTFTSHTNLETAPPPSLNSPICLFTQPIWRLPPPTMVMASRVASPTVCEHQLRARPVCADSETAGTNGIARPVNARSDSFWQDAGVWKSAPVLTGSTKFEPLPDVKNIMITGGAGFM